MLAKLYAWASSNWKLTCSLVFAFLIACVLFFLLLCWRDSNVILSAVLGGLSGWSLGILLAPYEEEQKKFNRWSKSLAGFVAGLSLAKLDSVFKFISDHNPQNLFRMVGMSLSWLLLGAIVVFIVRTYSDPVK